MKYSEHINAFYEQTKKFGIDPPIEVIGLIFENTERKFFKKGEIFLKQGEVCNEAYFIVKGIVRSYSILANGTEKTYIICRENNIFTESSSFMSRKPSTDFLEAIEDTEVLIISHENLLGLYDKYHIWETIGRKISDLNYIVSLRRLKSLMNDDAEERYKKYLHSYRNILDRIPQNIASSYLGITPQSFSRLKRELEAK
jgi:CRP-like cAMP-binding protein